MLTAFWEAIFAVYGFYPGNDLHMFVLGWVSRIEMLGLKAAHTYIICQGCSAVDDGLRVLFLIVVQLLMYLGVKKKTE